MLLNCIAASYIFALHLYHNIVITLLLTDGAKCAERRERAHVPATCHLHMFTPFTPRARAWNRSSRHMLPELHQREPAGWACRVMQVQRCTLGVCLCLPEWHVHVSAAACCGPTCNLSVEMLYWGAGAKINCLTKLIPNRNRYVLRQQDSGEINEFI